jgi:hypothetical protein
MTPTVFTAPPRRRAWLPGARRDSLGAKPVPRPISAALLALALTACLAASTALVPAPAFSQQSTFELLGADLFSNLVDFEIAGNFFYCGMKEGFVIMDHRDLVPTTVREFLLAPDSTVTAFNFNDSKAYITMGTKGVAIVNPLAPGDLGVTATVPPLLSTISSAIGVDTLVYVTEERSLLSYVAGNGDQVRLVAEWPVRVSEGKLAFAGDRLLVFGQGGLLVVRLANFLPVETETLYTAGEVVAAAGDGQALYAATENGTLLAFQRSGSRYQQISTRSLPGTPVDIAMSGGLVAVASDSGFVVYDVSRPQTPTLALKQFDGEPVTNVVLRGDKLVVARAERGFQAFSLIVGTQSTPIDTEADLGDVKTLALASGYLYASSPDSGVYRFAPSGNAGLNDRRLIVRRGRINTVAARDTILAVADGGQGVRLSTGPVGGNAQITRGIVTFPGLIFNIQMRDSLLVFAGGAAGLRIVSITDPETPYIIKAYDPPSFASYQVEMVESRLAYSVGLLPSPYLQIVDLAEPVSPAEVVTIPFTGSLAIAVDTTSDRMVAVHGPDSLQVLTLYDISSPRAPVVLNEIAVEGAGTKIAVRDNFVLLGTRSTPEIMRFLIQGSAIVPTTPGTTTEVVSAVVIGPDGMYVAQGLAGIASFVGFEASAIIYLGGYDMPGELLAMTVADSTVIVGDNQRTLYSLTMTNGGLLRRVDSFVVGGRVRALSFFRGDSVIAACVGDSLRMYTVSSSGDIINIRGGVQFIGAPPSSIVPFNNLLYVGSGNAVNVIDATVRTSPRVTLTFAGMGESNVGEAGPVRKMLISGNILYVVHRGIVNPINPAADRPPLVTVWNLAPDPSQPRYRGYYYDPAESEYLDAEISGPFLYLAAGEGGTKVLSVSTPGNPFFLGRISQTQNTEGLVVVDDVLILANGLDGVSAHNLQLSETNPPRIASFPTPGIARAVDALPGHLVVSDAYALMLYRPNVDLADTTAPTFAVGFVTNPFITAFADLFVVPSEDLPRDPLVAYRIADTDLTLDLNLIDQDERVYMTSLRLDRVGVGELEIVGFDVSDNRGFSSKTVVLNLLRGAEGGTISSDDSTFKIDVEPGALAGDARVIAMPYTAADLGAHVGAAPSAPPAEALAGGYRVALVPGDGAAIRVAFRVPEGADPAALQVYRGAGEQWLPLPSAASDGWVSAASDGGGLFWLARGDAGAPAAPLVAALHPNSPNPFNPATRLRYDVPAPGAHVVVEIYSPEGRLVRRLADQFQNAGRYELFWNGDDAGGGAAASGVYLLRYAAGEASFTRKLTLLR